MTERTDLPRTPGPATAAGRDFLGTRLVARPADDPELLAILAIETEAANKAAEGVRAFWTGVVDTERRDRIEAEARASAALDVERLAKALPYWRENNRDTCLSDAAIILDRLGLPPGVPIERHRDAARAAALDEVLTRPPYAAAAPGEDR